MVNVLRGMQTILTIAEFALVWWGVRWILRERTEGVRRWVMTVGVAILVGLTVYQRTIAMYSRWWLVVTVVFLGGLDFICYKKGKWHVWIFQTLCFETLYCLDLTLYISWKLLRAEQRFLVDNFVFRPERVLLFGISRGIVAVGIAVLYRYRKEAVRYLKSGTRLWIMVVAFEHVSLIICDGVFLPGSEEQSIRGWKLLFFLYPILLLILVFLLILQQYRFRYEQAGKQNALYAGQIQVMEKEKRERERVYHDFRNHLILLQGMLSEGDIPGAEEYLKGLLKAGEEKKLIRLGLPVLDYLLQMKIAEAKKQGIKVQEQYEGGLPALDVDGITDWCALLGNLWDNALEGCARLKGGSWIRFSMRREGMAVAVKMENSCPPGVDAKHPVSGKADRHMHGIGLKNIDHVVNKYGGTVERECRDGIFVTRIVIILQEQKG